MKHIVMGLSLVMLGCMGKGRQTLDSPCVNPTDNGVIEQCTPCTSDDDCTIVTNLCQPTGMCVPKTGRWAVIQIGCKEKHEPAAQACACVSGACSAK